MAKPKLVFFAPINDLGMFERYVQQVASLRDRFDLSVEVGTLLRKHSEELTDPGDSYLEYSVKNPSFFKFIIPEKLRPYLDTKFAEENLALMARKVDVLKKAGLHAAMYANEPIYQREPLYAAFPHWRGPRADHPRRSRNPIWAPCLLQPEVAEAYRETIAELCRRFPIFDTFTFLTNDCGSGFCWSTTLYNRPNGPAACRAAGPAPHVAAFHRAVIEGARSASCEVETFMNHIYPDPEPELCRRVLPEGAHILPESGEGATANLGSAVGRTYPVKGVEDALGFLGQLESAFGRQPKTILFRLGVAYEKNYADFQALDLLLRLLRGYLEQPTRTIQDRLALLDRVAGELYGKEGGPAMVEAWYELHRAFQVESVWPRASGMPLYNCVSARWLTRPLVAFPDRLTPEEERYWLPFVFCGFGEEVRRNLLDFHGGRAADNSTPGRDLQLRDGWFSQFDGALRRAASAFQAAAEKGVERARVAARALAILRCLYRNCRNVIDFALLMEKATAREGMWVLGEKPEGDPERQRVYEIVRTELDNALELIGLVEGEGAEEVIVTAPTPAEEDTFTLSPDLAGQLQRKRSIMLAHWRDFDQFFLPPHL
jgi:hypothetical protein